MEAVFLKVLNMSIAAGWLILVVVVLRLVLKKAPKWMSCLLWALTAVRLICPWGFKSALSLIPSAETIGQDIALSPTPAINSGVSFLNSALNPLIQEAFAPDGFSSANPLQIWLFVAGSVWIIGILAMVVYAGISYFRIHRKVGAAICLEDNIWICDEVKTPFILGIFRPRIFIPSDLEEGIRKLVLAHERAHLKRYDHLWKPLGFVILAVHWFNPLCWLAYFLLCRDIELACDEKVIRDFDLADKKAYSEALLFSSVSRKSGVACPLAFGEVGVKARIKAVLNYKKPAFWIIAAVTVACVVLAVCFLTDPIKKEPSNAPLNAVIPMVQINDKFYYDTGRESTAPRRDSMDGEITSSVGGTRVPEENDQSNFGEGYPYQYGVGDTVEICIDNRWIIFEYRSGDGSTIRYHDRWYSQGDLSEETIEWLHWYNGLSEEEQLSISFVPADLLELEGRTYPNVSDAPAEAE